MTRNIETRPCRCASCDEATKRKGRHPYPSGTKAHPVKYKVWWRQGGKRYSKSGFTRKVDAEAFYAETVAEVRRGSAPDPERGRERFETFAQRWLAERPGRAKSARTWAGYAYIVNGRLIPAFGSRPVASILGSSDAAVGRR
jgi:hypothetical protein